MSWPGSIISNKDAVLGYKALLLCSFTIPGRGAPLLLSTHPLDGVNGPAFPGISGAVPPFNAAGNYAARIAQQDIEALQQRSQLGIDRVSKFTVHILDSDHEIYTSVAAAYGFRGATLQVALVLWQAGTATFSTDAPILFTGTCDMEVPQQGGSILSVAANTGHDTATVKLPLFPIQNRCPLTFPNTLALRQATIFPDSTMCLYSAGVSGGVGNIATTGGPANDGKNIVDSFGNVVTDGSGIYIMCDYTRSNPYTDAQGHTNLNGGCMARLGSPTGVGSRAGFNKDGSATTVPASNTVAPDGDISHDISGKYTAGFAGIQWNPGTYYEIDKTYTTSSKVATFSSVNSSIWGTYENLLYGTQWVNTKIANVIESGNDTKCEAMICAGDVGDNGIGTIPLAPGGTGSSISGVVVNGVSLNRASPSGTPNEDPNLWWDFNNTGSRFGGVNTDTGYSVKDKYTALGDPYGSICCLRTTFYSQIFTGSSGVPSIRVLCSGPQVYVYAPIDTSVGDGTNVKVTFPAGTPDPFIAGAGEVVVYGNSLAGANGTFLANNADYGTLPPPGSVTYACSATPSGTGGIIGQKSSFGLISGNVTQANCCPPWVLLDLLVKANWSVTEIDMATFIAAGVFCAAPVSYINQVGSTSSHQRFKCQFVLEQRKSAAEVIAGVLRSFNGYLAWGQNGLLQLYINQTLGDSQPSTIPGSNYNTGVSSKLADGTTATGYLAYLFDESNIFRNPSGDPDIEFSANATVQTPNQIIINFQDEDNQFVDDSANIVDVNAVNRAGSTLQPGGSIIPETFNVIGISNFDQATRVANVYMAERQYGNELNIPIGTRTLTVTTTVRCEHLRVGHIVGLTLQMYNYSKQQFRVMAIAPSTDFQTCKLTLQWHNDTWYLDAYGQAPQAFYSYAGISRPVRAPHPWQADVEIPNVAASNPLFSANEVSFQLAEMDGLQANGNPLISLQVGGKPPINIINAACQPPLVPPQATCTTSAGSVPMGNYLVQICAVDASGNYTPPTGLIRAVLTGTGQITIPNIGWDTNTSGYDVFVGYDHYSITHQLSGSGTPSSITITSLPNVASYAPPDMAAGFIELDTKQVVHAGIIGEVVALPPTSSPNTVTIGAPGSGTLGSVAGRYLWLIGRPNLENNLPIITFNIVSNVGSVLTVDRDPTTLLQVGDVVVITTQATSATSTTITDTGWVSAYAPTGLSTTDMGYLVRIIYGTGRYQYRTITAVSASVTYNDTYTVSPPWTIIPDTTSVFIVEAPHFLPSAPDIPVNASSYTGITVGSVDVSNYSNSAMLVQPFLVDPTGIKYSNKFRSPIRLIWLSGLQGTRTITTSSTQTVADGTVLCDTSGVTGTTTTLSGAVSSGATSIAVVSATGIVSGTYLTIETDGTNPAENVFVVSIASLVITIASGLLHNHNSASVVDIPGMIGFTLLPAIQVPNQLLIVRKITPDINYVSVVSGGSGVNQDLFPNGGTTIILPDNSVESGSTVIKFPGQ